MIANSFDEEYDQQTLNIMGRILKSGSSCIDVGAHAGKVLSRIVDSAPEGEHYAFEPLPNLADSLRIKFPKVNIYQLALSNQVGVTDFHRIINGEGYSGIRLRTTPFEPEVEIISVKMDMLDNIIPERADIEFIKIDVEGAEYNVLSGGINTIGRCKPLIIFECGRRALSVYGYTFDDIYVLLVGQCGLKISTMKRWLNDDSPFSKEEFVNRQNQDYMWIAYG